MFTTSILVRFGDLDAAGIAYYPNLVNFLHEAFERFAWNERIDERAVERVERTDLAGRRDDDDEHELAVVERFADELRRRGHARIGRDVRFHR